MAPNRISNKILRDSDFPDLAEYFKQLSSRTSHAEITDHLLAGLITDAIPLRVLGVWITGFADAASIVKALGCQESKGVRRIAIRRFGRCLRKEDQIAALWDVLGGTAGLLQLFSELSIHDVQSFCQVLGRSSTFNVARETRRRVLTDFVMGLVSDHFPGSEFRNPERRSLVKFYADIVPACTAEFVRAWEGKEDLPRAGGKWMEQAHYPLVRERCMRQLQDDNDEGKTWKLEYFEGIFEQRPPLPASKTMSESMQFSLDFLRHLGQHEEIKISPDTIEDVAEPLLGRLVRRKAPLGLRARTIECIVQALRSKMGGSHFDPTSGIVMSETVRLWERSSEDYEGVLFRVLELVPPTHDMSLVEVETIMESARLPGNRYRLLGLILKHLAPFARDLESDNEVRDLGPWPKGLFMLLPSREAHDLLQRIIRLRGHEKWDGYLFTTLEPEHAASLLSDLLWIRPAGDFIDWSTLSKCITVFSIAHNQDVRVLQLYISPKSPEVEAGWQKIVDEHKQEAARARDQAIRAMWARCTIVCSAASGSYDCYESTLLWARRFNRDPLTVKTLYGGNIIMTEAGVDLISGVVVDKTKPPLTSDTLRENVQKGNKILLLLLETAFQAVNEPSFQPADWASVLQLFSRIVEVRLSKADEVQDRLALSDDQVYDYMWQPTLETLLSAEELCLREEHEGLRAQRPSSLLGCSALPQMNSTVPQAASTRVPTFRFIDELARCRDELWTSYRISRDPNVVSLLQPWPKGLAFQHAVSIDLAHDTYGYAGLMPFLMRRAEEIVFPDASAVLRPPPEEKQMRKAIDVFIDDYRHALVLFVKGGVDREDRDRRRDLAWEHAMGPLSENRMSALQASTFWGDVLVRAGVEQPPTRPQLPIRSGLTLPSVDDPEEPTEWQPEPEPEKYMMEGVELEPTALDWMLEPTRVQQNKVPPLGVSEMTIPFTFGSYAWPMKFLRPSVREALLGLALMLINSRCCPDHRLFSRPFPNAEDSRFPAMFLDEEFLERDNTDAEEGFTMLERLSRDAPLTLIAELCGTMLDIYRQSKPPNRTLEDGLFRLLKILVDSDRPNLAAGLAQKVVLDCPSASSWHRHVLTPGLFNGLPSAQAHRTIRELADSVVMKLQRQARLEWDPDIEPAQQSGPIIKVTTITALAQLLSRATFISKDDTINTLITVFVNASHPDVRVAIIQSLTSILLKARDDHIKTRILDALKQHAVPVAASVNERAPMSETDWQRAEENLVPPEVHQPDTSDMPPVLASILAAWTAASAELATQIYQRLLLPILDTSAANNARWMCLFLRANSLEYALDRLPHPPVKPHLLHELTKRDAQPRREEIFRLWGSMTLTALKPEQSLAAVNQHILSNKDLRASNSGKHWLSTWHREGVSGLSVCGPELHAYLTDPRSAKSGALPMDTIKQTVLRQFNILLSRPYFRSSELEYLVAALKRPEHKSADWEMWWERHARPVVREMVDTIESMRSDNKQHERLTVLRDSYDLHLWLLTWRGWSQQLWGREGHEARLQTLAAEVVGEIQRFAERVEGEPYHERFGMLKLALEKRVNPYDMCDLALALGKAVDATQLRLADFLLLEIIEALLSGATTIVAGPPGRAVLDEAVEMVEAWMGSEDERVKMSGMRLIALWEKKEGQKGGLPRAWKEREKGRMEVD